MPALAPSEPITAVSDGRTLSANDTSVPSDRSDPAPAADPHREAHAGDDSASHFSATALPTADDATVTAAFAAATPAAFSSPDVTVGTADGATAAAASAADTGMGVDTDPSPAVTAPPTAEHVSSFLLHIRRRAADDATATAASAAATPAAPPSPDVTLGTAEGATATAASAADTGMNVDIDVKPSATADDAHAAKCISALLVSKFTTAHRAHGVCPARLAAAFSEERGCAAL